MKDRIERIKEILKEGKLFLENKYATTRAENLFNIVKNIKIGYDDINKDMTAHSHLCNIDGQGNRDYNELKKHSLLAITPITINYGSINKPNTGIIMDRILEGSQTIFMDLDKRIFSVGSSDGSSTRETYGFLAPIFEKAKSPTLVPLLFKKEIVICYAFPRFVGYYHFLGHQNIKFPEELTKEGYEDVTCAYNDINKNIVMYLQPENKKIYLLKLYNPEK